MDRDPSNANDSFDPIPAPDGFPEGRHSTERNPGQKDLDTDASQTGAHIDRTKREQSGEEYGRIKQPMETPEKNLPRGSEPETHARK